MANIFISYASEDKAVAAWFAESLGREGWNVWWDSHIAVGKEFALSIEKNLAAADCVIVIWTKTSVESTWVRSEATQGMERHCLLPVRIGAVKPPLPFDQIQTVDLTGWRGDADHPAYQKLLRSVRDLLDVSALPSVDRGRFSVVVAHIENDIKNESQTLIAANLSNYEGIFVVKLDRPIYSDGPSPEESLKTAEQKARDYLARMGASVMVWGRILRLQDREVPHLYLTVSRGKDQRHGQYLPTESLRLPPVFWTDLAEILALVVLSYDAEFRAREGSYLGDSLRPIVPRIRRLLLRAGSGWSDYSRGLARINLGDALMILGAQGGDSEPLKEAVETYRTALRDLPREESPRDWARAQNGLGISLRFLGSQQGNAELLEQAGAAYQQALAERMREREPLDWAQTHNDLGNVLVTLGQWEAGTKRLAQAVHAYETALLERTIEANRLDWAQTKNNLGVALWHLGQREHGVQRLEDAAAALTASFKVYTREKTPLDWSQTQNNLGLVLWTLGDRQGSTARLEEAVSAHRNALKERKREHVPLLWAQTQNNLGLALWSLGNRKNDEKNLEGAVEAFTRALREATRERAPMDWAQTQNNLGAVLWSLGKRRNGTQELEQGIQAYRNALTVYSREGAASEWAKTQHNLGNALATLGDRENDNARLQAALECLRAALGVYNREQEPMLWAQTQGDFGYCAYLLGKSQRESKSLEEALRAFKETQRVYEESDLKKEAEVFAANVQTVRTLIESQRAERKRKGVRKMAGVNRSGAVRPERRR